MKTEIKLLRKDVYGRPAYYPQCKWSRFIAQIAGTKTITKAHLLAMKEMGEFWIDIVYEEENL